MPAMNTSWMLLLSAALIVPPAAAQDGAAAASSQASPREPSVQTAAPAYRPPTRSRPRRRIGGGVRSAGTAWPHIYALVPEHTGLTSSDAPSLFWSIDATPPEGTHLALYVINDRTDETLLEAPVETPAAAGIQRIDLAAHGVALDVGTEYEWSVALERETEQVLVTTGWISRVAAPTQLASDASAADYAGQGLWYDALARLGDRIQRDPGDTAARRERTRLLNEVGLSEVGP